MQDGNIPQLIRHVKNRKKSASRGHQLPPEERKKEREKEKKRKVQEQVKQEAAAVQIKLETQLDRQESQQLPDVDVEIAEEAIEPIERATSAASDVLEIELEEKKKPKQSGTKKKLGVRMTKADKSLYLETHKVSNYSRAGTHETSARSHLVA